MRGRIPPGRGCNSTTSYGNIGEQIFFCSVFDTNCIADAFNPNRIFLYLFFGTAGSPSALGMQYLLFHVTVVRSAGCHVSIRQYGCRYVASQHSTMFPMTKPPSYRQYMHSGSHHGTTSITAACVPSTGSILFLMANPPSYQDMHSGSCYRTTSISAGLFPYSWNCDKHEAIRSPFFSHSRSKCSLYKAIKVPGASEMNLSLSCCINDVSWLCRRS